MARVKSSSGKCKGIVTACHGDVLSFVLQVMRKSAKELSELANSSDPNAFLASDFAGSPEILLSSGGMVVQKAPEGAGFSLFASNCTGVA